MPPTPPPDDDPQGFAALLAQVEALCGFRALSYKERCLRRRVAVRMRARSAHSFGDYAAVLAGDAGECERLVDVLTINVTKLFRNAEVWSTVAERVIPALWSRPGPFRAWCAGCASGEEAYSVAALLHAHALAASDAAAAHALARIAVVGSDIDRASLAAAARATYAEGALVEAPAALRARYFPPLAARLTPAAAGPLAPVAAAAPELRALVRFVPHDLLRDAPLQGPWRLIVCRNVVIYFDRASQEALFERLHAALEPGGVLFLGKVETLFGRVRGLFAPIDARQRLFRRL